MQDNGLDVTNWDIPIYRVFPKRWFKEMITTKTIGLLRSSKWEDPFENFFLKCRVKSKDGQIGSVSRIRDSWYGQCWTLNHDSDAMWRIYSHCKDGICVSSSISKLFSAIYNDRDPFAKQKYFIGVVQYQERSKIEEFVRNTTFESSVLGGQVHALARTLLIKRPEFSNEKEVRLLYFDAESKEKSSVSTVPFDYEKVLDDAVLDPRLEAQEFKALKDDLLSLGCKLPISQSNLYRIDQMTINLD